MHIYMSFFILWIALYSSTSIIAQEQSLSSPSQSQQEIVSIYSEPNAVYTEDWSKLLLDIVQILAPHTGGTGNIVEVGVFEGRGTNALIQYLLRPEYDEKLGLPPRYQVYAFDIWENIWDGDLYDHSVAYNHFLLNTVNARKRGVLFHIPGPTNQTLPMMQPKLENSVSFAYIDGDHRATPTYMDAVNVWPMLRIGGWMLFDDYLWPKTNSSDPENSPQAGINRFINEYKLKVHIHYQKYQLLLQKLAY